MRARARYLRCGSFAAITTGTKMKQCSWLLLVLCVAMFPVVGLGGPPDGSPHGHGAASSTTSTTAPVAVTYSGRAFAAFVDVPALGVNRMYVSDTGFLPPEGGLQTAKLADVTVPSVLSAQILIARTSGANGVAESSAALADVNVLDGLVTATFIRAESEATCNGVRGSTEVVGLTVAGNAVTADAFAQSQPVTVVVPGVGTVTVVINEQVSNTSPGFREITVNAVHVTVTGLVQAEVILSSAHSDIDGCPSSVGGGGGCPPAPECHDFVTGGGFIAVPGGRANFGFNAGIKPNAIAPDGHLNYVDHATGMHVKSINVANYTPTGATSRSFGGDAEVNGQAGFTYIVDVADNGEPGHHQDTFRIRLPSISYDSGAGKTGAGKTLEGGNIQLHKPCP